MTGGPSVWVPATHAVDPEEASGSLPSPMPTGAIAAILGMKEQREALFLLSSFELLFKKTKFRAKKRIS